VRGIKVELIMKDRSARLGCDLNMVANVTFTPRHEESNRVYYTDMCVWRGGDIPDTSNF
jgi:hypothetical protein